MQDNVCLRLFSDNTFKISTFRPIKKRYEYLSPIYKYIVSAKCIQKWNFFDGKRFLRNMENSIIRTRKTIRELIKNNDFDYFMTVTFNRHYVHASDAVEVQKTFRNIIKRLKYNFGNIKYLQVGEFHSDIDNIHYHVLISFEKKPKLKYRRKVHGRNLYTISDKFYKSDCFITLEKVNKNDKDRVTEYILKYITKSSVYPFCRRFGCSRNLNRVRELDSFTFDSFFVRDFGDILNSVDIDRYWYGPRKRYECWESGNSSRSELDLLKDYTKDEKSNKVIQEYYKLVRRLCEMTPPIRSKYSKNEKNSKSKQFVSDEVQALF